jgi:cytochrome P450
VDAVLAGPHPVSSPRDVFSELAAAGDGSDAAEVPLLQAVIHQTLRLASPVTVAEHRTLAEDADLLGRPVTAGTTFTPSIYLAHRRPGSFPDPHRFDPYRFLGNRVAPQYYFPFAGEPGIASAASSPSWRSG